ncbi:flagellar biosynthesis anti-sigma factor FlgM [Desulfovibrio sp. OttesenSCG-928-C14]|nr:flagellar biosynthesis anti-sigma factor FlgM [Desulfovibrio sp. OttesenSCG-928-C14]
MEIKNNFNRLDPYLNRLDLEPQRPEARGAGVAQAAPSSGDTVSFSATALKAAAMESAAAAPEVRSGKVAEIKARVESGQYQTDSLDIADKILRTERGLLS